MIPAPPDAPLALVTAGLSRSAIQLAWTMPADTDAAGFHLLASADGVNFTSFATIADPTARAFTAAGLDPNANYTFTLTAYNDTGDSEYSYSSSASTTNDDWETIGRITPDLGYDESGAHPISWFTPPTGQGEGDYFHYGIYQFLYAGGAYNLAPSSGWMTSGYFDEFAFDNGSTSEGQLGGVAYKDDLEQAQHDTYAMGPFHTFSGADLKIGARFAAGTDPDNPGPGVTWTLQRRVPHAGVYALYGDTTEGDTGPIDPLDPDNRAKLFFTRDDRITEDLTIHFHLDTDPTLTAGDYTAIEKIPDGNGGFTEQPFDLDSGTLTFPASTFGITGIEVDITAADDTTPEWTEALRVRLQENTTYIADHAYDHDGNNWDDDGSDTDPDAAVLLKDNDLSFELAQGTLVANYNDTNNDGTTDYEETDSGSDPDLYEMTLHVPRIDKAGAKVVLELPANFVNVYLTNQKGQPLTPDDPGGSRYTWDGDASQVPQSVWLEVKAGSQSVDGMTCSLSTDDNGAEQNRDQQNTPINFHINLTDNPNGGPAGDIKDKSVDWLIGQMTDLSVSIEAPSGFKTAASYSWSVPGNVLHDYVIDNTEAYTLPLVDSDMQGEEPLGTGKAWPEVRFSGVSTDAGSDQREVSVQLTNVDGKSYTVKTKFVVNSPTVTATPNSIGTVNVKQAPSGDWVFELADLVNNLPGFRMKAKVEMPQGFPAGTWTFLQTTTSATMKKILNGPTQRFEPYGEPNLLDLSFPYPLIRVGNDAPAPIFLPTGTIEGRMGDFPGQKLTGLEWYARYDSFSSYVMFKPSGDARWVPLKVVYWGFGVNTSWNAATNKWDVQSSDVFQPTTPVNVTAEPTWNKRQQDGLGWVDYA